jgi:hypothetical protein
MHAMYMLGCRYQCRTDLLKKSCQSLTNSRSSAFSIDLNPTKYLGYGTCRHVKCPAKCRGLALVTGLSDQVATPWGRLRAPMRFNVVDRSRSAGPGRSRRC